MLAPWKKSYEKTRWHIKEQETSLCEKNDYIFKGMVFPVVMYGYECCTIKKSEHEELMFSNSGAGSTLESPLD